MVLQADGMPSTDEMALAQLYHDAPSLRARHLEKHLRWQELFAPDVQRRLGLPATERPDPRARALVAAALACLDATINAWYESGGTLDPVQLFDDAIATIRR